MVKRASRGEKLEGLTDMPAKIPACQSTPAKEHSKECQQIIVKPIHNRPTTEKKDEKVDEEPDPDPDVDSPNGRPITDKGAL